MRLQKSSATFRQGVCEFLSHNIGPVKCRPGRLSEKRVAFENGPLMVAPMFG